MQRSARLRRVPSAIPPFAADSVSLGGRAKCDAPATEAISRSLGDRRPSNRHSSAATLTRSYLALVRLMFDALRTFVLEHRERSAVLASSGLFLITVYTLTVIFL